MDIESLRQQIRDSEFMSAYVEAMLWTEIEEMDDHESAIYDRSYLDRGFDLESFDVTALQRIIKDCSEFQAAHGPMIELDPTHAGHDFWLTRQGHGCGFWDGDWPQVDGEKLTEACKALGERYLECGDDGKLYLR